MCLLFLCGGVVLGQEVGLSMGPVAAFLEAAAQLGLKAEDALKEVQQVGGTAAAAAAPGPPRFLQ